MRTAIVFLFLTSAAFADDVAVCDPTSQPVVNAVTRFERTVDGEPLKTRSGFLVWQAPHNLMTPEQQVQMNTRRSQFDALSGVPTRYWKCVDTDADGLLDGITEMTQVEKDVVDAPTIAAQQQAQADTTALATLDAQLDTDLAGWDAMTNADKLAVAKKLLRRDVLKRRLGR